MDVEARMLALHCEGIKTASASPGISARSPVFLYHVVVEHVSMQHQLGDTVILFGLQEQQCRRRGRTVKDNDVPNTNSTVES